MLTLLAGLLVLTVLVAPSGSPNPVALLRIPVEALVGVAVVLLLPPRPQRIAVVAGAVGLGALAVVKLIDAGFRLVLQRPYDTVSDWDFLVSAFRYLYQSAGPVAAAGWTALAIAAAGALAAATALATVRLSRAVVRHRRVVAPASGVLLAAWVACAVLSVQILPGVPIAAHTAYDQLEQVRAGLQDRRTFAAELAVDPWRDVPATKVLTALRGKDVVVAFIESYGRVAFDEPAVAARVEPVLADGERRLRAAGFDARSAYVTSPTVTGGSWLAHATLLSGLWVNTQQRYRMLLGSDRFTLGTAFRQAGWRTVGVMPGLTQPWPEGAVFGYDRIYAAADLGYRGPAYSFATIPDQYALAAFQRLERTARDRAPVMAEIPLTSSHAPWAPIPQLRDWNAVGDGSTFAAPAEPGGPAEIVLQRDRDRVLDDFGHALEYSLATLISYVETYGDENLVLVFLGDHQPAQVVTGEGAGRDVPITVVAQPDVLDRIAAWGWHDGLRPGADAPVWRMDAFRDHFLTAFSDARAPS